MSGNVGVQLTQATCITDASCVSLRSSVHAGELGLAWRVPRTSLKMCFTLQMGRQSYRKMTENDGDSTHERLVKFLRHLGSLAGRQVEEKRELRWTLLSLLLALVL